MPRICLVTNCIFVTLIYKTMGEGKAFKIFSQIWGSKLTNHIFKCPVWTVLTFINLNFLPWRLLHLIYFCFYFLLQDKIEKATNSCLLAHLSVNYFKKIFIEIIYTTACDMLHVKILLAIPLSLKTYSHRILVNKIFNLVKAYMFVN